jgi:hypothetical protein
VDAATLAEVAGHGLHVALFAAGLVSVAVLLWVSRPRRPAPRADEDHADD